MGIVLTLQIIFCSNQQFKKDRWVPGRALRFKTSRKPQIRAKSLKSVLICTALHNPRAANSSNLSYFTVQTSAYCAPTIVSQYHHHYHRTAVHVPPPLPLYHQHSQRTPVPRTLPGYRSTTSTTRDTGGGYVSSFSFCAEAILNCSNHY